MLFYNYYFIFITKKRCCFVLFLLIALYVCTVFAPDYCKGAPYECCFLAFGSCGELLFNIQYFLEVLILIYFYLINFGLKRLVLIFSIFIFNFCIYYYSGIALW